MEIIKIKVKGLIKIWTMGGKGKVKGRERGDPRGEPTHNRRLVKGGNVREGPRGTTRESPSPPSIIILGPTPIWLPIGRPGPPGRGKWGSWL